LQVRKEKEKKARDSNTVRSRVQQSDLGKIVHVEIKVRMRRVEIIEITGESE
jgi:hypothetical protein